MFNILTNTLRELEYIMNIDFMRYLISSYVMPYYAQLS